MISQSWNCVAQGILLLAVFFFWGLASRRWGGGVDTSLHPLKGSSPIYIHVLFAVITALLIGAIIIANTLF